METHIPIRIVVLVCLVGLFLYTVYLIRANKLSAHLAISWIMTELLLIASVILDVIPETIRLIVGESDYYTAIFVLVIGWIILLMLDTLTRVSEVENKARVVVQENSLLQRRIEELEESVGALSKDVERAGQCAPEGDTRAERT
jgi:hypothetical protein